ncbi:MAG: hypothetical protein HY321_08805 [Armatimonadetes bacterium]|nr:hypothetical protein [Armatimonadota bacterium]
MVILADSDVLRVCAASCLLEYLPPALGVAPAEIHPLSALRHQFRSQALQSKYGPGVCQRSLQFLASVGRPVEALVRSVDSSEAEALAKCEKEIQSGEAAILMATRTLRQYRVVTGDKRCLRTLAAATTLAAIRFRMEGRVLCLAQVLRLIVGEIGAGNVVNALKLAQGVEGSVDAILRRGPDASRFLGALDDQIANLRAETGNLLVPGI